MFKRYDIRGEYPEELNEEFAERLGKSLGTFAQRNYSKDVVVCRDNKESSNSLKEYFIAGLQSVGVNVLDVGEGPTDYAAFAGNRKEAVSAQVTSSHMALNFNGFKFMYPAGNGFKNPDLDEVKRIFREEDFETGKGTLEEEEMHAQYLEDAKEFLGHFDLNFSKDITLDALNGASLLKELLEELDVDFDTIEREKMPNPPNPKPEMLDKLKDETEDIGFGNDLDADRVTVYYNNRFLTGNELIGVFAQLFEGDVVASVDTSESLKQVNNGNLFFTRVGDPFVMDKALEEDVKFAAEPNGHYAFPEFVAYNSGTVAATLLAGLDLDKYLDRLPEAEFRRESFEVEDKEKAMDKIGEAASEHELLSDIDGYKLSDGESIVLARPSGSSPKIRLVGESSSDDFSLMEELGELLEKC
ncbi:MAG: phosphoglucosamine mutase [Candidatus Nanohaloarchaea archaeon]